MDLPRLVSLLDLSALHFARADKMADPFEGSWTKNQPPRELVNEAGVPVSPQPTPEEWAKLTPPSSPDAREARWRNERESIALNCWHHSEHESEAMWKLYAASGIAVESTFGALVGSFASGTSGDGTNSIQVGAVRYVDYQTAYMPVGNAFWPFVHKRLSFAHEREVRAVIKAYGEKMVDYGEFHLLEPGVPAQGFSVPVKLETLVRRIYVAPSSPGWFKNVVQSVVRKYGYGFEVRQSDLDAVPFHHENW